MDELAELVARLARHAYARDRQIDPDARWMPITDDEAVMLLEAYEIPYWDTRWQ